MSISTFLVLKKPTVFQARHFFVCSVLFDNKVSHLFVVFFIHVYIFSIDIFIEKLQRAMHDETKTFWKQQLS